MTEMLIGERERGNNETKMLREKNTRDGDVKRMRSTNKEMSREEDAFRKKKAEEDELAREKDAKRKM